MPSPIATTAEILLQQELERDPEQFRGSRSLVDLELPEGFEMTPLSPRTASLAGGLADAASTYYFLKSGRGRESNALVGATKSHPEATAAAALGGYGMSLLALKALRKLSPNVARAVEANLGALQLGYAANNMRTDRTASSSRLYSGALQREQMEK